MSTTTPLLPANPNPGSAESADRPRTNAGGQGGNRFSQWLQRSAQAQAAMSRDRGDAMANACGTPPGAVDAAPGHGQVSCPDASPDPLGDDPAAPANEADAEAPRRGDPVQDLQQLVDALSGFGWPNVGGAPLLSARSAPDQAVAPAAGPAQARRGLTMAVSQRWAEPLSGSVDEADRGLRDGADAVGAWEGGQGAVPFAQDPDRGALDPAFMRLMEPLAAPQAHLSALQGAQPSLPSVLGTPPSGASDRPGEAMVYTLSTPLDAPEFPAALAHQVSYLVREGVQEARLTLNPAELGPVSVHIAVTGQQAQVDFAAALGSTRSALESSFPHLASALQAAGLTLTGAGVSQDPGSGRGWQAPASAAGRSAGGGAREDSVVMADRAAQRAGQLDLYA